MLHILKIEFLKSHKKFDSNKSNAEKMATFNEIYGKALIDDAKFEKLFNRWLLNKKNGKQNEKIYFDSTKNFWYYIKSKI
jgi:hypothetical protein